MRISLLLLALSLLLPPALRAQCGDTTHTAQATDGWASCQVAPSPNPARGSGHWIMYDFGYVYTLTHSHIWNGNVSGETDQGFRDIVVDYSLDGDQWAELGSYELPEASGDAREPGQSGPDFGGVEARYVLLTALTNWGDPQCFGLAEVRFGLEAVTGLDPAYDNPLTIFPNPASSYIEVDFGQIRPQTLRLVNLEGRILQQYTGGIIPARLDLSELPTGLFFLSVQGQDGRFHSRSFVKE
ncbi:MAG: T9SS C-terminal target domain-containing protein [Bacteroidetes bacterium]|nr:MAG: T9SS C-terminal target domain-containing protein [Bacteroidota bacterium]